jgi:uncharacterized protein with HEPN domain
MPPETLKFVYDIREAALLIEQFTKDKSVEDYLTDVMLRSAVERQFTVLGEALSQALKADSALADHISNARAICNFRNVLIHGYAVVKNETVWGVIEAHLPKLLSETEQILNAANEQV